MKIRINICLPWVEVGNYIVLFVISTTGQFYSQRNLIGKRMYAMHVAILIYFGNYLS